MLTSCGCQVISHVRFKMQPVLPFSVSWLLSKHQYHTTQAHNFHVAEYILPLCIPVLVQWHKDTHRPKLCRSDAIGGEASHLTVNIDNSLYCMNLIFSICVCGMKTRVHIETKDWIHNILTTYLTSETWYQYISDYSVYIRMVTEQGSVLPSVHDQFNNLLSFTLGQTDVT